jgi:hypothetical protein
MAGVEPGDGGYDDDELNDTDSAVAAICAIEHFDWLAVITALAVGGPGTPASATDLAVYVRDYEPEVPDEEQAEDEEDLEFSDLGTGGVEDFDELGMEGLFVPVTALWQVLGAIDDDERLTPLGWWGLPEAMLRVWALSGGAPG